MPPDSQPVESESAPEKETEASTTSVSFPPFLVLKPKDSYIFVIESYCGMG